jgi:hypothetical protein
VRERATKALLTIPIANEFCSTRPALILLGIPESA